MSAKRAKIIGVAAVGALAVTGAISATALSSGPASASANATDAYVTVAGSHPGTAKARQADTMDAAQRVVQFGHVRFGLQHQIDLTDAKAAAQSGRTKTQTAAAPGPSGSPQQVAAEMLGKFGWSSGQFSCLEPLWEHESGWNVTAENPSSGAYGIPQALSGAMMASSGPDWQTDAATQIRWGLTYIQGRYGSPCGAWAHEEADNWY
ncbi:MAG: lytic transglycosylase domain-containing protein [Trebonia sp.]